MKRHSFLVSDKLIWMLSLIFFNSTVGFADVVSVYTRVNEKQGNCIYKEVFESEKGPGSCEYQCKGPIQGVTTHLLSCSDYEHLYLKIDNQDYSTWEAMLDVGLTSGMGNKKGLIEWDFDGKSKDRSHLIGFIVRFDGDQLQGEKRVNISKLAVFGLRKGEICWKGNVAGNEEARRLLEFGKCKAPLKLSSPSNL